MAECVSGVYQTTIVLDADESEALLEALRFCAVDGDLPLELTELFDALGGA